MNRKSFVRETKPGHYKQGPTLFELPQESALAYVEKSLSRTLERMLTMQGKNLKLTEATEELFVTECGHIFEHIENSLKAKEPVAYLKHHIGDFWIMSQRIDSVTSSEIFDIKKSIAAKFIEQTIIKIKQPPQTPNAQ